MFQQALASILAVVAMSLTSPAQALVDTGKICKTETERMERTQRIPKHLLTAISIAESGRWNKEKQENVAWPWTVTSGGAGRFFPTKKAAVDEVHRLQARGVTNIDVGCMQINLGYHGDNFVSLNHAFDPAANVAYGADFLKRKFKETKSWTKAASYYHSRTPHLAAKYRKKVERLWAETRENERIANPTIRMASLNRTFQERRAAEPKGIQAKAQHRYRELQAWREARAKGTDSTHVANIQRVRKEIERNRAWKNPRAGEGRERFAAKRRAQLRAWRLSRS